MLPSPHTVDDPRDNYEKLRRIELVRHGVEHGVDVNENMPAMLIRHRLRAANIPPPAVVPYRPLGIDRGQDTSPNSHRLSMPMAAPPPPNAPAVSVDAIADLERQFANPAPLPPYEGDPKPTSVPVIPLIPTNIVDLRRECKRLGIKMDRRDRMPDLIRKIKEHGKDPA